MHFFPTLCWCPFFPSYTAVLVDLLGHLSLQAQYPATIYLLGIDEWESSKNEAKSPLLLCILMSQTAYVLSITTAHLETTF